MLRAVATLQLLMIILTYLGYKYYIMLFSVKLLSCFYKRHDGHYKLLCATYSACLGFRSSHNIGSEFGCLTYFDRNLDILLKKD